MNTSSTDTVKHVRKGLAISANNGVARRIFVLTIAAMCLFGLCGCYSIGAHVREFTGTVDFDVYPATRYISRTEWDDDFLKVKREADLLFPVSYWLDLVVDTAFLPIDAIGCALFRPDSMSVDECGRIVMPRRWGEYSEVCPNELDDAIQLTIEPESGSLLVCGWSAPGPRMYDRDLAWVVNTNGVFEFNMKIKEEGLDCYYDTVSKRVGRQPIVIWLCPPDIWHFHCREYRLASQDGDRRVFNYYPWTWWRKHPDRACLIMRVLEYGEDRPARLRLGMDEHCDSFAGKITATRRNGELMCTWTFSAGEVVVARKGFPDIVLERKPWIESELLEKLGTMSDRPHGERHFSVPHIKVHGAIPVSKERRTPFE